jgi:hypothetical protein
MEGCSGILLFICALSAGPSIVAADGLRSDPEAVAHARAMVERMGGAPIWAELRSVHFVHEWDVVSHPYAQLFVPPEEGGG